MFNRVQLPMVQRTRSMGLFILPYSVISGETPFALGQHQALQLTGFQDAYAGIEIGVSSSPFVRIAHLR